MLHHSPCEFYIKSLLLQPEQHTNQAILDLLHKQKLDPVEGYYLDELRADLKPPSPFYPRDQRHRVSIRFLHKEQVFSLFHPEEDMRLAYEILSSPRNKVWLEVALIHEVTPETAARVLRDRGMKRVTPDAVKKYRHFFWNLDLVDSIELDVLLALRADVGLEHTDGKKQAAHFKRASYRDPRRIALGLPNNPASVALARHYMGEETKVNRSEILDKIIDNGLLQGWGTSGSSAPHAGEVTGMWLHNVDTALRIQAASQDPNAKVRGMLQALKVKAGVRVLPTVTQVSDGRHTTELMSPVEKDKVKK